MKVLGWLVGGSVGLRKNFQIEGFLVKERVFKFRGVGFGFFRGLLGFRVC